MEGDLEAMARQHAPFLRRLALALVGDHHGAEELVQETWLAAASQPGGHVRSPRAWLAGTARRLAAAGRRTRGRRRETHLADEPAIDAGDPMGIAAKLEAERVLGAALEALPEAQRTALWLRYREGLGIAEIAERVGAPANTVRDRLRRGLGSLRQRLDQGTGGMAFTLAPLLPRDPIGGTAAATGSKATMATSVRFAQALLALVLLSAVGALVALGRDDGMSGARLEAPSVGPRDRGLAGVPRDGSQVERASSGEERQVVAAARKAVEATRPDDVAAEQEPGSSTPTVRVSVLTEAGTPAARALVWSQERADLPRFSVPDGAAVADDAGVVVLEDQGHRIATYFAAFDDPSGRTLFGRAFLHKRGYGVHGSKSVERGPDGESAVVIQVSASPLLGGRVINADGAPISGASVRALVRTEGQNRAIARAITDADGGFLMTSIPLPVRIPPEDALCRIEVSVGPRRIEPVATRDHVLLDTSDTVIEVDRGQEPTGAIVGELRIAEGAPECAGCQVSLRSLSDPDLRVHSVSVPLGRNGEMVAGVLHASSVPPGHYALIIGGGPGGLRGGLSGIEVRAGETTDVGVMIAGAGGHVRLVPTHASAGALRSTRGSRRGMVILKSEARELVILQADESGGWRSDYAISSGRWSIGQGYKAGRLAIDAPPIEIVEGRTIECEVRFRRCQEYAIVLEGTEDRSWSSLTLSARETGAGGHWRLDRAPASRPSIERDGLRLLLPEESSCEIRVTTETGLRGSARVTVRPIGAPVDPVRIELGRTDGR